METPNEYRQKVLDRLHEKVLSGDIDKAAQLQIIELMAAHLYLMTTTTFSRRSGKSYRAIRNRTPDAVIDGIQFYAAK